MGGRVSQIDVRVLLKGLQDLLPNHFAGLAPLVRFAVIADCQLYTAVFDIGLYNRDGVLHPPTCRFPVG